MSSRRKPAGRRVTKTEDKKEPAKREAKALDIDAVPQLGEGPELSDLKKYVLDTLKRLKTETDRSTSEATKGLESSALKIRKRAKMDKATMQAAATQIEEHFRQYANDSAEDIQEIKTASETLQLKCRPGVTLTTRLLPDLQRTFESNLKSLATKYDPTL